MADTIVSRVEPDLSRTRPAAHALFYTADQPWEVPSMWQLFLIEPDGTRVAVDSRRNLHHPRIQDLALSAELLGVEPGTRFQVEITRPTGIGADADVGRAALYARHDLTAENIGVISGAAAADLPIDTIIQDIHNRSRNGRYRRTPDGWHCEGAPRSANIHESWHRIAGTDDLNYRILDQP